MNSRNFWDRQHNVYDTKDWINKPSLFAQWAMQFFPKTGTILELGAGHGTDSRFFANKGYQVISTDFSETAIQYNKDKLPRDLEDRMIIEHLDLSKPFKYEDNSFDVVYSHLAIHYFTKSVTEHLFKEIYRVLKPYGIIALLTNSINDPEYNTGRKIEEDYFETVNLYKRYFSIDSMNTYTKKFNTLVLDNKGQTYKDKAIGVENLIRYIGKK